MRKYYTESRRRGISYIKQKEGSILKHTTQGQIEGGIEVTGRQGIRRK
jgi:hypothetical protein